MKTPKPIALVGVPTDDTGIFDSVCDMLHGQLPEYHVLTFIQKQGTKPHIEVHNAPVGKTGIISLRSLIRDLCKGKLTEAPASRVPVEQDPKEEGGSTPCEDDTSQGAEEAKSAMRVEA